MESTHEVMILTQAGPSYRQVETGSTVGDLTNSLVDEGLLASALDVTPFDGTTQQVSSDTVIDEDVTVLNYITKLAGA